MPEKDFTFQTTIEGVEYKSRISEEGWKFSKTAEDGTESVIFSLDTQEADRVAKLMYVHLNQDEFKAFLKPYSY